jgi:hypothetical protein
MCEAVTVLQGACYHHTVKKQSLRSAQLMEVRRSIILNIVFFIEEAYF